MMAVIWADKGFITIPDDVPCEFNIDVFFFNKKANFLIDFSIINRDNFAIRVFF